MDLRILSASDLRRSLGMAAAIAAMRSAFRQLSSGRARVPLRLALETEGGITLVMPAALQDSGDLAVKVVSVFEANPERGLPAIGALVVALDSRTGLPAAVLEGASLTALRTGAASGLATDLLARPEARVLAVFGAGVQARTQIEAVRAVRRIEEVRIVSRSGASAERLAAELDDVRAHALRDGREALRGADVVVAATTSRVPVFPGDAVEPGAHVNGIGSYTAAMRELDATLVARATVVVDSRESALAEAGDLVAALREGTIAEEHIRAELGDVVAGRHPGRTAADEVTLFKSVGNAAQDAALAGAALRAAEASGAGTRVRL